MTWYHTGGRRARTRISVREAKRRERERKQATEISVDTGPSLEWPDRALDYLWGTDRVPDRLAWLCRELMWSGIYGEDARDVAERVIDHDTTSLNSSLAKPFRAAGAPSPSRWQALGQILGGAELILEWGETGTTAAKEVSLPTSSRLSELLHNHTGLRITTLPDLPTPRWRAVTERWWGGVE